ncbi:MAG: HAMP domain-containing protein [Acidobacteria bacterium]|nr:HAMP domain-containing protein [Acidobacteriota bacterium]
MINLKDLRVKYKILLLMGIFVTGFSVVAFYGFYILQVAKVDGSYYNEIQELQNLDSQINPPKIYLLQAAYDCLRIQGLMEVHPEKVEERVARIEKAIHEYEESHAYWEKTLDPNDPEQKELREMVVVKAHEPAVDFIRIVREELIPAARRGDLAKVRELNNGILFDRLVPHWATLGEARKVTAEEIRQKTDDAAWFVKSRPVFLVFFGSFLTALTLFIGWRIVRIINEPLAAVDEKLRAMAAGEVDQTLEYRSKDEIGSLTESFRGLVEYFKEIAHRADDLRRGDFDKLVVPRSEKDQVSINFLNMTKTLHDLVEETKHLSGAAAAGDLSVRGEAARFEGGYRELIDGMNQTFESMVAPINEAADRLRRVAAKDLTAMMTGDYRGDFGLFKESLNTALENLNDGLLQVASGAEQVAAASEEISSGSQSLAKSSSDQASTLEEVNSSLQEISSIAGMNRTNSQEAQRLSEASRSSAAAGLGSMTKLSHAMDRIKESSDSTAKIVKTIEEIAFQTNLLALNAAVEAARAGDAGKGFAVVAEEVRNLAMRSAEAAKNTARLIDDSVRNTEEGVTLNKEVSVRLEEINGHIEKVNAVVTEIVDASEQQNNGIGQITTATEQISLLTQQNAANSEESAGASEELSAQSEEMLTLIGTFNLIGGTNAGRSRGLKRPANGTDILERALI